MRVEIRPENQFTRLVSVSVILRKAALQILSVETQLEKQLRSVWRHIVHLALELSVQRRCVKSGLCPAQQRNPDTVASFLGPALAEKKTEPETPAFLAATSESNTVSSLIGMAHLKAKKLMHRDPASLTLEHLWWPRSGTAQQLCQLHQLEQAGQPGRDGQDRDRAISIRGLLAIHSPRRHTCWWLIALADAGNGLPPTLGKWISEHTPDGRQGSACLVIQDTLPGNFCGVAKVRGRMSRSWTTSGCRFFLE